MIRVSRLLLSLAVAAGMGTFAFTAETKGEWTGFVTDTHCGKKMASAEHSEECLRKCVARGSKAHLVDEKDQKMYDLDDHMKVAGLVGQRITIKGTLDDKTNAIKIESAAPAAAEKPADKAKK
jgi:hypothetical protein